MNRPVSTLLAAALGLSSPLLSQAQVDVYKGDVVVHIGGAATNVSIVGNLALGANASGNELRNEGTLYVTGNVSGAGTYEAIGTTDGFFLNGTAAQTFGLNAPAGLGRLIASNPVSITITNATGNELRLNSNLTFTTGGTRYIQPQTPGTFLAFGPDVTVSGAGPDRFVRGPIQAEATNLTTAIVLPIGTGTTYRPLVFRNPGGLGPLFIRGQVNGTTVAGQPDAAAKLGQNQMAKNIHYRMVVSGGSLPANTEVESNYTLPVEQLNGAPTSMRLAIRPTTGPVNSFTEVPRLSNVGETITSQFAFGLSGDFLLAHAQGKTKAGTLANQTIPIGTSVNLELLNEQATTYQWFARTGTDPLAPVGATGDAYLTPPLFTVTNYAVVGSEANYESDTTALNTVNFSQFVALDLRVLLEGGYDQTLDRMRNPTTIPAEYSDNIYRTALVTANTSVPPGSHPTDAVDRITLELRPGGLSAAAAAVAAGPHPQVDVWLRADGTISHYEAGDGLTVDPARRRAYFTGTPNNSYYVVVRHRNHLPIMSAAPVALSQTSTLLDLTVPNNVYVNPALMRFGGFVNPVTNRLMLFGGNANIELTSNGYSVVGARDFSQVMLNTLAPASGYLLEDINLDGFRNAADRTAIKVNAETITVSSVQVN